VTPPPPQPPAWDAPPPPPPPAWDAPPPPPTGPTYVPPVAPLPDFVVLDDDESVQALVFIFFICLSLLCKLCFHVEKMRRAAGYFVHLSRRKRTRADFGRPKCTAPLEIPLCAMYCSSRSGSSVYDLVATST
jgi:hypothetical protein